MRDVQIEGTMQILTPFLKERLAGNAKMHVNVLLAAWNEASEVDSGSIPCD